MKTKLIAGLILLGLCGCTSGNAIGPCIGAFDSKDPSLEYKLSVRNTAVGFFFSGFFIPPVIVLANETFCPVGKKPSP